MLVLGLTRLGIREALINRLEEEEEHNRLLEGEEVSHMQDRARMTPWQRPGEVFVGQTGLRRGQAAADARRREL